MNQRQLLRFSRPMTLLAATLVTVFSLWVLAVLNSRASFEMPVRDQVPTVSIQPPESNPTPQQDRKTESERQRREPDVMEMKLDAPSPETVSLRPLELDLKLPSPTVVPVEVTVRQPEPEPPKPKPKPKPPEPEQEPEPEPEPSSPPAPPSDPAPAKPSPPAPPSEPTVQKASEVDQPPRETRGNPAPAYPAEKLRRSEEGKVRLRLLIDESGEVEDVEILSGDEEFRRAVMSVVWKWRFRPARDRGQPVKVWGVKDVQFRIRGRN